MLSQGSQLPVFGSYLCGTTPVPDAPAAVDPYWPADLVDARQRVRLRRPGQQRRRPALRRAGAARAAPSTRAGSTRRGPARLAAALARLLSSSREEGGAFRALGGRRHAAAAACARRDRAARARRRGARAAARAERRHRHARRPRLGQLPGHRALQAATSATRRWSCSCAASCRTRCSPTTSGACCGLEGCLSGNVPDTKKGLKAPPARLPPDRRPQARQGRVRPRDVHQHRGQPHRRRVRQAAGRRPAPGRRRPPARRAPCRGGAATRPPSRSGSRQAAAQAVNAQFTQYVIQLGLRYGITGHPAHRRPRTSCRRSCSTASAGAPGVPKSRFAYLFPSPNAAMITIRLKPDLSNSQRRRAIDLFRTATEQRVFQPRHGAHYIVSGVPVVSEGLADAVQTLDLRAARRRAAGHGGHAGARVPHPPAAAAARAGAGRGRAHVRRAVARRRQPDDGLDRRAPGADRARGGLLDPVPGALRRAARARRTILERRPRPRPRPAARRSSRRGSPPRSASWCCCCRRFRWCAASARCWWSGSGWRWPARSAPASRRWCASGAPRPLARRCRAPRARLASVAAHPRVADAREWLATRAWQALGVPLSQPRRVLAIALILAVAGLAADTQSEVISDVRELVPANLQELRDVNALQDETGVSGEIDVTVRARDITDAEGDRLDDPLPAAACCALTATAPASAAPSATTRPSSAPRSRCRTCSPPPEPVRGRCASCSTRCRRTSPRACSPRDRQTANLAFGIRLMPLDRQKEVVDDIERRLDPPPGVQASVVGLPVLAAEANAALSSPWRRGLTLRGGARRRLPRPAARAPLGAPGGDPADPDRARHRLVRRHRVPARAAARPARGRPQPDVGHARRARDRDLHRVQRAAVLALPAGARAAARARRGRSS